MGLGEQFESNYFYDSIYLKVKIRQVIHATQHGSLNFCARFVFFNKKHNMAANI